ncbi:response regulator receiver modulated metal dependent phosphohydrolase [Desulfovibrio sp. X2]|uniref:HD domain-containing phosphohydrolase n=1 Tax=Desulfovibrio sp. X2 TaxID=941449 RepID=UPI000358A839|nr:HD domain-containing phosphohydrolase [Desulfovibrio sp. X2]EPR38730.1 response regulator receiver modulated metal dependent phosphohydrolase [Desulfovibrio sp. X2]
MHDVPLPTSLTGSGKRILVVDDDRLNRKVLDGMLKALGHEVIQASSGPEALSLLDESCDLVFLDVMMPGMDGFACTRAIRQDPRLAELPVIIVTTLTGREDRLRAVEAGANDFIAKPIDLMEVKVRATSLLRMKESRDAVKRYQADLEEIVRVRTQALQVAVENLREQQASTAAAYREAIHCLCSAAEYKDEETAQHIIRIGQMSGLLAAKYGISADEVELLRNAAPMHDVGKIGVPDAILLKPGKLDPNEWKIMQQHAEIGARILGQSTSELLQAGALVAHTHHEKWDGSGYPRGLSKTDIPLYGRICAVADVFDALTSRRPYKEPFSVETTLEIMRKGRGSHFDPDIFDLFLDNLDGFITIKATFLD